MQGQRKFEVINNIANLNPQKQVIPKSIECCSLKLSCVSLASNCESIRLRNKILTKNKIIKINY